MIVQEYWADLLTVYVACLVAFTSPGPNFVAVTSYSVESRAGYGVAIGISLGTAIWALFAAFAFSTGSRIEVYIKYKPYSLRYLAFFL